MPYKYKGLSDRAIIPYMFGFFLGGGYFLYLFRILEFYIFFYAYMFFHNALKEFFQEGSGRVFRGVAWQAFLSNNEHCCWCGESSP